MALDNNLEIDVFKKIGVWAKILALTAIITGCLSTLLSLARILKVRGSFIWHLRMHIYQPNAIIMPLILIFMGFILLKVSNNCNEFSAGKFDSLARIFGSLKTFFWLLLVLLTIAIITYLRSIIWGLFILRGLGQIGK